MRILDSAFRTTLRGICVAAAMLGAQAASAAPATDAQRQYQADRAACVSGQTGQAIATCLREAGAALQEARRGNLKDPEIADYEGNRYARCDLHRGEDRSDCIRRMNGEGTVTGSVQGGGIYRELRTIVPARE